jgi:imidazolonepropionase-like amidohydrolase
LADQQRHVCYDFFLEPVRQFHSLGGVLALGTDYNSADPAMQRGMPLREMKLLLAAGLAPLEVIEAGTRNAAYVCGHGDDLGTLQAGKLADMIVVNGNPLDNIEAMKNTIAVIINGQVAYEAK